MRYYFLRLIIWAMRYDLALTKQRLQECKDLIADDERRIHFYEIELMNLGEGK